MHNLVHITSLPTQKCALEFSGCYTLLHIKKPQHPSESTEALPQRYWGIGMEQSKSNKPLSAASINSLKPGNSLLDAGEYRGLRVECGLSGAKTFVYRYRSPVSNKVKRLKLGRYRGTNLTGESLGLSLAEARVEFQNLKAQRDAGVCLVERKRAQVAEEKSIKPELTIELMVTNYLSNCIDGKRTNKAATECRRTLYGDAVKVLGRRLATEVTTQEVLDMIEAIINRGANVQAGNVLRELSAAFDYSLPMDALNPCDKAKRMLKRKRVRLNSKRGTRVLNDGELATFLKWLPGSRFTVGQKGVMHLTLLTGCRSGEVCSLKWKDLDLEAGIWRLNETKTGVPREVQLSNQAVTLLLAQQRLSAFGGHVFLNINGSKVKQKTISETAWRLRSKNQMLDIDDWTAHDLRRSVRTGLARLGCPSDVAEAVLGHSPKGIEAVYNLHGYEKECGLWLQTWCNHIDALQGVLTS